MSGHNGPRSGSEPLADLRRRHCIVEVGLLTLTDRLTVGLHDIRPARDGVLHETLQLKVENMEAELVAGSTALGVKLPAKRVALSWLTLQAADVSVPNKPRWDRCRGVGKITVMPANNGI